MIEYKCSNCWARLTGTPGEEDVCPKCASTNVVPGGSAGPAGPPSADAVSGSDHASSPAPAGSTPGAPRPQHCGGEALSKRQRYRFAILFALAPNAIALLILHARLFQSPALWALAYCASLPGALVASLRGAEHAGTGILHLGVLLNVLLDAWVAYRVTALRNRGLGMFVVCVYVVSSRLVAYIWWLILLMPYLTMGS